jgi:N-acetylneuraminic acid mutarotase
MQWSKASCAGNAPAARSSQSLTAHGDCMYVFGGECTPRIPQLFCYNNMQHTWQQLKVSGIDDLGPRLGHSMTAIGRDLYTFGGRTGIHFADSTLGDLYKIDIDTLICSEVRGSGTAPEPRSYHSAVSSGNNLYLFGGCGAKGRLNDLHQYDTKTNSWQTLPSQPGIKVIC